MAGMYTRLLSRVRLLASEVWRAKGQTNSLFTSHCGPWTTPHSSVTQRHGILPITRWTFTEHGVVPDIIDVAPAEKAEVKYDSDVIVELGNELTPTQVQNAPQVMWPSEEGSYYTLIMTDPDAPSRADPKWGEWRHWLVFNILGNQLGKGDVWWTYIGSGPPKDTGLHRYVFLIYKQPAGRLSPTEPKVGNTGKGRNNTKAKDIVANYNLGNPVAGNFYQAQWDDYVPILYSKLD